MKQAEYDLEAVLKQRLPDLLGATGAVERLRLRQASPRPDREWDMEAELRVAGRDLHVLIEAKMHVNSAVIGQLAQLRHRLDRNRHRIFVLVAPKIGPKYKRMLEEQNLNYIDLAGNICLRAPGVFIKQAGQELPRHLRPPRRKNPFADKASLIARVALSGRQPAWGVRELAAEAGVAVGWASEIVRVLEARYYVGRDKHGKLVLEDPVLLLEDWSHFYSYERNRIVSYFAPFKDPGPFLAKVARALADLEVEDRYALSLLAAANVLLGHVRSDQVHIYVSAEKFDVVIHDLPELLHLERADAGGNLHVLRPYYRHSFMFQAQKVRGLPLVSDVQLYLDLHDYPLRGREAAEALLRRRLGAALGLESRQYERLLSK